VQEVAALSGWVVGVNGGVVLGHGRPILRDAEATADMYFMHTSRTLFPRPEI
jgi:hypothetical protein